MNKTVELDIDLSSLLSQLQQDAESIPNDGAMTRDEIESALGISSATAHRRIKAAITAGTIEHIKTRRQGIDGVWRWVSGYRVRG